MTTNKALVFLLAPQNNNAQHINQDPHHICNCVSATTGAVSVLNTLGPSDKPEQSLHVNNGLSSLLKLALVPINKAQKCGVT